MAIKAPIGALRLAEGPSSSSQAFPIGRSSINFPLPKTSFFNGGVGALKSTIIQLTISKRHHCGWHGGGALGAQMNLFNWVARIIKSYAIAIVSSYEDPEKILDQAVLEMNDDLIKLSEATAQLIGSQKQLENKYKAAQEASDDWYRRAQEAVAKGEEDLARETLKRHKFYADNANALKVQLDQHKRIVQNLVYKTKLLQCKIEEAGSKKETLKARAQSAKTATTVSEMLGNVKTGSAFSAFAKMEEKVQFMEAQAEALNLLTTNDLEVKFVLLESSSVDGDLAKLRKEASETLPKGELPVGGTAGSSTNASYPFRDMREIVRELNDQRAKVKEPVNP